MGPKFATIFIIAMYLALTRAAPENETNSERFFPTVIFGAGLSPDQSITETTPDPTSIVGAIPLVPTLKLAAMAIMSTFFLPGLHIALTAITIFFSLIGIAAFTCANLVECNFLHTGRSSEDLQQQASRTRLNNGFVTTTRKWNLPVTAEFAGHMLEKTRQQYGNF